MHNYYKIEDWEFLPYEKLLIHLYQHFDLNQLKQVIKQETSNLKYITTNQLKIILDTFGDMSIFQSKLNVPIMKDRLYCQYCRCCDLKETTVREYIEKKLKLDVHDKILNEVFNLLIFHEVLKIYNDPRYKIILKNNYN